jgi:hypothetical protein
MGYPIELQAITNWFASKGDSLAGTRVTLAETAARSQYVAAARADFDSDSTIGDFSSLSGISPHKTQKPRTVYAMGHSPCSGLWFCPDCRQTGS